MTYDRKYNYIFMINSINLVIETNIFERSYVCMVSYIPRALTIYHVSCVILKDNSRFDFVKASVMYNVCVSLFK